MTSTATTRRDIRIRRIHGLTVRAEVLRGWDGTAQEVAIIIGERMRSDSLFGHAQTLLGVGRHLMGRSLVNAAFDDLRERMARRLAGDYAGV